METDYFAVAVHVVPPLGTDLAAVSRLLAEAGFASPISDGVEGITTHVTDNRFIRWPTKQAAEAAIKAAFPKAVVHWHDFDRVET
jgi:hypothetical protein